MRYRPLKRCKRSRKQLSRWLNELVYDAIADASVVLIDFAVFCAVKKPLQRDRSKRHFCFLGTLPST